MPSTESENELIYPPIPNSSDGGNGFMGNYVTKDEFKAAEDNLDKRFDAIDMKFEEVNKRFDQVDQKFKSIDERFDKIDFKFQKIVARFDHLDAEISLIKEKFKFTDDRFDLLGQRVDYLEKTVIVYLGMMTIMIAILAIMTIIRIYF
ncbi:hypothetical protein [Companilactobacillus sp.]|uniref:hypothetical protein n=1 Tax=Companilactobacillus sp. TaxID=2767905 RepID=UPI00262E0E84|nr:hypothetical protein [Companilactobacillus sp.]